MKKASLLLGLLLVVPSIAQEHAPTAAQCKADLAVWDDADMLNEYIEAQANYLSIGTPNRSRVNRLGEDEVTARMLEMSNCEKVDREGIMKYDYAASFYDGAWKDRFVDFVKRHNLLRQLKLEDAQGKR